MSRWISNLASRMKDSLRNRIGKVKPSLKKHVPSLKKYASPIVTIDLSRRVTGDLPANVREGLFTRIEIRLTRWSIILLAVIALIYILPQHIRELFEPARSPSVTPQAISESEYQKKTTSQKPDMTKPGSAQGVSIKMEQPGNLIDPEFSITLLEENQSSGLRLCIVNKNPSATSTLRNGDSFKIIFPPECGRISLIPNSIVVKSSILSPTDFQTTINSNQVYLTYIGRDKTFLPLDSCCFDVTPDTFYGFKSGYIHFSASGVGIINNPPIHLVLPSALISKNVARSKTINFKEDYKRYIGSYYPPKPHKKLAKINSKKQRAKPVTKSGSHRKDGTHVKPIDRNDAKKSAKDKKKAKKRQHS